MTVTGQAPWPSIHTIRHYTLYSAAPQFFVCGCGVFFARLGPRAVMRAWHYELMFAVWSRCPTASFHSRHGLELDEEGGAFLYAFGHLGNDRSRRCRESNEVSSDGPGWHGEAQYLVGEVLSLSL